MGITKKNIFVFVVCGDDSHIRTLNFSLKYLRHFSEKEIIVVTDTSRNTCPVIHETVIDKKTPAELTHHQAAIWLKTSLHRILDMRHTYCYLDSDVIAVSSGVDSIFEHHCGPVTFARDHLTLSAFSPVAVNCHCKKKNDEEAIRPLELIELYKNHDETLLQDPVLTERFKQLEKLIQTFTNNALKDPELIKKKARLDTLIEEFESNTLQDPFLIQKKMELDKKLSGLPVSIKIQRQLFSIKNKIIRTVFGLLNRPCGRSEFFAIGKDFGWNGKNDFWCDSEGRLLYDKKIHNFHEFFRLNGGFRWDNSKKQWADNTNNVLFDKNLHDFDYFFEINGGFRWDQTQECWYDKDNNLLYNEKAQKEFSKKESSYSDCRSDKNTHIWYTKNGANVFDLFCHHLIDAIDTKFDIKIDDIKWRHWNGGVFVFNDQSIDFLNTWHQFTMEIIKDPFWATRDQGTLAAVVWKYNLQDKKTLPVKYNCIIDYYCPDLVWHGSLDFTLKNKIHVTNPCFLHIYHAFGKKDWNIWQEIENIIA